MGLLEHFSYYTNISNLVCILYFIVYIIKMIIHFNTNTSCNYSLKGAMTISIMITMLVFNLISTSFVDKLCHITTHSFVFQLIGTALNNNMH